MKTSAQVALLPLFCLGAFFPQPVFCESGAEVQPARPFARPLGVSDITIPSDLGYIAQKSAPSDSSAALPPLIIHIQEVHVSFEAQQRLANILQQLVERYGVRLILVEGGQGDVGLSYLRNFGPPENRKEVAEKYLRLGLIGGEEYLDIVSDLPLVLWGVEERKLYQENVEAFLEAEALQQSLAPPLAAVQEAVEALKAKFRTPDLSELEAKVKAFQEEQLELDDYALFLAEAATRQGLAMDSFPHLSRLLSLHAREETIDQELVEREQRGLFTKLRLRGLGEELNRLIAEAKETPPLPIEEFYPRLTQLARKARLLPEDTPHLSRYVDYVASRAQLEPSALGDELDRLTIALRDRLLVSAQAQQLYRMDDQLTLIERLIALQLAPKEYEELKRWDLRTLSFEWSTTLGILLAAQGFPARSFDGLRAMDAALPRLRDFYETAKRRDEAMVERTLAKLRATEASLAVLITGGFHSSSITSLLEERGLAVVVVTPKISAPVNERLYSAVLKFKSGRASFEELERAAAAAMQKPDPALSAEKTAGSRQ